MKSDPTAKLCLILTGKNLQENVALLKPYQDLVDLIEIRADYLFPEELPLLDRYPNFFNCPAILTIRRQTDGGLFCGSESDRQRLWLKALQGNWAFCDLETDCQAPKVVELCRQRHIRIIRSLHDFKGVPANLEQIISQIRPAEIPKIAVFPQALSQFNSFLSFCLKTRRKPKIMLAMGPFGTASRILSARLGSYLSYCCLPQDEVAPGQLSVNKMTGLYRFKQLTPKTKVYGIIGNPIAHSFSPLLHNKSFRDLELDAVYIPFLVEELAEFFKTVQLLKIQGFSVTVPHKRNIINFLNSKDALVEKVGACNTVVRRGHGFWGSNTDVAGFLAPLAAYFNDEQFKRLRVTVIGSGGAARAVLWALKSKHVPAILVLNRTVEKAKMLATEFETEWAPLAESGFKRMCNYDDLIVQTTDVGMYPHSEADPLEGYQFDGHELVYDLIYNPRLTRLLVRALEAGCKVINGEEMLIAQAAHQFRLFTEKEATFKNCFLADLMAIEEDDDKNLNIEEDLDGLESP